MTIHLVWASDCTVEYPVAWCTLYLAVARFQIRKLNYDNGSTYLLHSYTILTSMLSRTQCDAVGRAQQLWWRPGIKQRARKPKSATHRFRTPRFLHNLHQNWHFQLRFMDTMPHFSCIPINKGIWKYILLQDWMTLFTHCCGFVIWVPDAFYMCSLKLLGPPKKHPLQLVVFRCTFVF